MSCYRFIAAAEVDHAVALSCALLGVSRSGFYTWEDGSARRRDRRAHADAVLTERIRSIHQESAGMYGAPQGAAHASTPSCAPSGCAARASGWSG